MRCKTCGQLVTQESIAERKKQATINRKRGQQRALDQGKHIGRPRVGCVEEILKRYERGDRIVDISVALKISRGAVEYALRRNGK